MRAKKLLYLTQNGVQYDLTLEWLEEDLARLTGTYMPAGSGEALEITPLEARVVLAGQEVRIKSSLGVFTGHAARTSKGLWLSLGAQTAFFESTQRDLANTTAEALETEILAPMTGKIIDIRVEANQQIKEGEILVILEAMKMEFKLEAPMDAVVESVSCETNQQVELGDLLVKLEPNESAGS